MIFNGDRDELGKYVREMADLCGLRDWTVRVDMDPCDEDNAGECRVIYGRKYGIVRVSHDWAEKPPEELRNTIIHELLHMHCEPMMWAVNNVQVPLGSVAFGILDGSFRDALEVAVDSIATAWAETLPLPITGEQEAA